MIFMISNLDVEEEDPVYVLPSYLYNQVDYKGKLPVPHYTRTLLKK